MATLSFQGHFLHTNGELPAVGSAAPDFSLTNAALQEVTLHDYAGKRKIFNIVPSLDTPICATSARKFNEKIAHFSDTVVLLISADLPFAQCRFCSSEGLHHVVALSTFRTDFASVYGVNIIDGLLAGLTARAIVIVDAQNTVIYTELVSELTHEPHYEQALAALKPPR